LDDVRKIVVLRPSAVGDFVFALPALQALKQAYPEADLVLAGNAWQRTFLRGRAGPVDRVVAVPPVPGVDASPETAADTVEVERFIEEMRAERFDLALQMAGGGRHSNPFLLRFGARLTVGARTPDAPMLDRWIPYRTPSQRRLALLEVASLAGAAIRLPPAGQPELALTEADCDEAPLVRDVAACMHASAIVLAGRLRLGGLCGLLARTALLVSNDTGPLHLGLALGVPSVGIFWLTNLMEGMPLRPSSLHAALAARTRCPVCDQHNLHTRCPHDVSFVDDVTLEEVEALARAALVAGRYAAHQWPDR
jgi:ADP-heptose:LPS heptosyltransferase